MCRGNPKITRLLEIILPQCLTGLQSTVLEGSAVFTAHFMKRLISFASPIILLWTALLPAGAQVNVTQKNNNPSRDGHYIDAAFTPTNAASLTRALSFNA